MLQSVVLIGTQLLLPGSLIAGISAQMNPHNFYIHSIYTVLNTGSLPRSTGIDDRTEKRERREQVSDMK
jgi:hypothetical protein